MAIENVVLIHDCFPKHLGMGTARMNEDKETGEGKQKILKMRSKVGTEKNHNGQTTAQACRSLGSQFPKAVNELPNLTKPKHIIHSQPPGRKSFQYP